MSARLVALLRAVNVGGRVVKMEQLRKIFESLGFRNVSTLITSGNVLFESPESSQALEETIEQRLQAELGYPVATFIRSIEELRAVGAHQPFKDDRPGSLHVLFLKRKPTAQAARALLACSNAVDRFRVRGREAYWHAAQGMGGTTVSGPKLAKLLGPATARNITTVRKLAAK
jgi:uncharacterized protein (DUF1697 family)